MPNIKSAKKRVLVSEANNQRNKAYRSALRTAVKKADAAIESKDANAGEAVKAAVEQFCKTKFAEDTCPKQVFIKDHLPLNKGNKPDILALEKEAAEAMER